MYDVLPEALSDILSTYMMFYQRLYLICYPHVQRVYGTISHFIPMKSHVSVLQLPCHPWHLQDLELRSLLRSGASCATATKRQRGINLAPWAGNAEEMVALTWSKTAILMTFFGDKRRFPWEFQ